MIVWQRAAQAAEDLAAELLGESVRKAVDPLTPEGFLIIGEQISSALSKAAAGAEAGVVSAAMESLDVDWDALGVDEIERLVDATNAGITKHYASLVMPKIAETLEIEGPDVMKGTKKAVVAREKFQISSALSTRDIAAEKAIRTSQVNFIRDSSGKRLGALSAKAREITARGFSEGLGRKAIGSELRKHFAAQVPRPTSYWNVVAASYIGRARSTSQIYAYEDAEVETFEVVAVIDEVTTDQCRFMNGKVFTVFAARKLLESVNELDDPEDVKYANPWIRKGKDPAGGQRLFIPHKDGSSTTLAKIARSGVGARDDAGEYSGAKSSGAISKLGVQVPPYHGECRTVIIAGSEASDEKPAVMVPGADLVSPEVHEQEQAPEESDLEIRDDQLDYLKTGMKDLSAHMGAYDGATPKQVEQIATGKLPTMNDKKFFVPIKISSNVAPVLREQGKTHILEDGRHRLEAARRAGAKHILAEVDGKKIIMRIPEKAPVKEPEKPAKTPKVPKPKPEPPPAPAPHADDWMRAPEKDLTHVQMKPIGEGVNGAEMLTVKTEDGKEHRAVWKRADKEYPDLRAGIEVGTYHQREQAMHDLDKLLGGETVVPTTVSRQYGNNTGSMQAFVPAAKSNRTFREAIRNIGTDADWASTPIDSTVRRTFLLDVLAANDDRHGGNVMWKKAASGTMEAIAIDNGLTFPAGPPSRFLFPVPDTRAMKSLLKLDPTSVAQLDTLKLGDVAGVLKAQPDIQERAIEEALARVASLKSNPQQLAEAHAKKSPYAFESDTVHEWLYDGLDDRLAAKQITQGEYDEIKKLSKR